MPLKNKKSQTITDDFSKILTTSKQKLLRKECDRGADFYNSNLQNFLKVEHMHHYLRLTEKAQT